jgi:hypothetical protein
MSSATGQQLLKRALSVEEPLAPSQVTWAGYLRRKGDLLPRWDRQYCVQRNADLSFYATEEDAQTDSNISGLVVVTEVHAENYGKVCARLTADFSLG